MLLLTFLMFKECCKRNMIPRLVKQGIGNQMFEFLIKKAQACQCTAIELTSANYRKGAHAFYKAIGFSPKKTTVFIKEIPER